MSAMDAASTATGAIGDGWIRRGGGGCCCCGLNVDADGDMAWYENISKVVLGAVPALSGKCSPPLLAPPCGWPMRWWCDADGPGGLMACAASTSIVGIADN